MHKCSERGRRAAWSALCRSGGHCDYRPAVAGARYGHRLFPRSVRNAPAPAHICLRACVRACVHVCVILLCNALCVWVWVGGWVGGWHEAGACVTLLSNVLCVWLWVGACVRRCGSSVCGSFVGAAARLSLRDPPNTLPDKQRPHRPKKQALRTTPPPPHSDHC
jgi:hypothetical protein